MIRAQCHNYIKALEGAVVLTFSQQRLSFPPPLSHFQLVNVTPGLRPTALPAVPAQLFVGIPCKPCTEMARVGFTLPEAVAFLPWVSGWTAPEGAALALVGGNRCIMGKAVGMRFCRPALPSKLYSMS